MPATAVAKCLGSANAALMPKTHAATQIPLEPVLKTTATAVDSHRDLTDTIERVRTGLTGWWVGTRSACGRRVAQSSTAYEPGDPTSTVLYGIVWDHFATFRAQAASLRDGEGLPRFVERAFRDFLRCGCLAGGFARFWCAACGTDRLVAFS
jgi:hypothetical protein